MRSFAIVIRRAYFEAKKRRKYAKNVVVNRSESKKLYEDILALLDREQWGLENGV